MTQIVSSPSPDAFGAKATILATLHSIPFMASTLFFNIKMGTSNWPVGMQGFFALYIAGLICLTRSHTVIKENSSLPSIFSKGSNKRNPQLRIRAPIISSHQGPADLFHSSRLPFPC